jgi:lisH domain-containing protein FOPNL
MDDAKKKNNPVLQQSEEERLRGAVRHRLAENGTIGRITAEIRAEVAKAIRKEEDEKAAPDVVSGDNFVLNELIREYLEWNDCGNAAEALVAESGHPRERVDRRELEDVVGVRTGANAARVPLLYSMLAAVRNPKV